MELFQMELRFVWAVERAPERSDHLSVVAPCPEGHHHLVFAVWGYCREL